MLSAKQRERIGQVTEHWLHQARLLYRTEFDTPELRFDLRGLSAGQYRFHPHPIIRFNAEMAARQFEAFCHRTPPHEVAHHIVARLHGFGGVRPHGHEWQEVMRAFGLEPTRCHQFDTSGMSRRRQRRFRYRCGCREHELSATRHNRVQRGEQRYSCRHCGEVLVTIE